MPINKITQNTDEEIFEQLFSNNIIYEIPLFQRNYKWSNDLETHLKSYSRFNTKDLKIALDSVIFKL